MRKLKFALSLVAMLMMTLAANAWEFKSVTPAQGNVESISKITLEFPDAYKGTGLSMIPGYMWVTVDGVEVAIGAKSVDLMAENLELYFDSPITSGTVELKFGMGGNQIWAAADGSQCSQTFTWTVGKSDGGNTGNNNAAGYTLTYDKASELLKLTKDGCTSYDTNNAGGATLEGYEGLFSFNPADPEWTFMGNTCIAAYVALPDGTYTLHVQAGTYLFDGVENEAIDITFTVGTPGGGGGNFEWSGTPSHETIFKSGETTISTPIVFETEGVKVEALDGLFELGGTTTTIPFGYNTYDEKELDWNNKCQFVVTAKQDINKIIFIPTSSGKAALNAVEATGGEGSYSNGVWEGKLATGETLTLKQTDGTQIKEIYVCYNGDDFDPTSVQEEKGVITIQYPVENQKIAYQANGGKMCTFTTNKEYAQVTIQIINNNPVYDNLYSFPVRMFDNAGENSDGLHVGENTVTAATPDAGNFYFFKGDSYKVVVKGFINMWDVMPDNYDAIAEVNFVGDGMEHTAESIIKLLSVTPATNNDQPAEIAIKNGIVTLEFDGAVQSVEAITPGGQMDPTIYHTATPKAGSDNKVWEINLGDRSGFASADTEGDPIIEVDVTAKDADGAIVVFSNDRADRGLMLKYKLVDKEQGPAAVTLGTPVWSVAEGAEIEASTKSINIMFPNAANVEAGYTLEVSGTIGDKSFNLKDVSGTGTMGAGADIAVSLSENTGYNLVIGTITVKNGSSVVYSTDQANYQLNFGTKAAQGGGDSDILGDATFSATADGIVVEWPNANVSGINECVITLGEWTLTHNGVDYIVYPDQLEDFSNGVKVEVPYTKIATWNDNTYTFDPVEVAPGDEIAVSIAAEGINVFANYYSSFDPAIYTNAEPITGTVTVPGGGSEAKEVVLYDYATNGASTTLDGNSRIVTVDGVTLTATGTNNYTVPAEGGSFSGLRVGKYVTVVISAETEIEKIEVTTTGTVWSSAVTDLNAGSFDGTTWTGSSKSVTFKTPSDQTISKIVVTLAGGTPTAIQNVESVKNATVMYNLAGQRINNAKGIVIMNGKKYMVK